MRIVINEAAWEFIAKYLCDMSKAISAVGLASSFFKTLPWDWRIGLVVIAIAFLIISVIIINNKGGKQ